MDKLINNFFIRISQDKTLRNLPETDDEIQCKYCGEIIHQDQIGSSDEYVKIESELDKYKEDIGNGKVLSNLILDNIDDIKKQLSICLIDLKGNDHKYLAYYLAMSVYMLDNLANKIEEQFSKKSFASIKIINCPSCHKEIEVEDKSNVSVEQGDFDLSELKSYTDDLKLVFVEMSIFFNKIVLYTIKDCARILRGNFIKELKGNYIIENPVPSYDDDIDMEGIGHHLEEINFRKILNKYKDDIRYNIDMVISKLEKLSSNKDFNIRHLYEEIQKRKSSDESFVSATE